MWRSAELNYISFSRQYFNWNFCFIYLCASQHWNLLICASFNCLQETAHSLKTPNQKYAIQTFFPPNVHCYSQTMIYFLPLSMQTSILISVLTKPLHCITVEFQLLCLSKGKATASQEVCIILIPLSLLCSIKPFMAWAWKWCDLLKDKCHQAICSLGTGFFSVPVDEV